MGTVDVSRFERQQIRYSPHWAGRAELEHTRPLFRGGIIIRAIWRFILG